MFLPFDHKYWYGQYVVNIDPLFTAGGMYTRDSVFILLDIPTVKSLHSVYTCTLIDANKNVVHNVPLNNIFPLPLGREVTNFDKGAFYMLNSKRANAHSINRMYSSSGAFYQKSTTLYKLLEMLENMFDQVNQKRKKSHPFSYPWNTWPVFIKVQKVVDDNEVHLTVYMFTDIDIDSIENENISCVLNDPDKFVSSDFVCSKADLICLLWDEYGSLNLLNFKEHSNIDYLMYIVFNS